MPQQTGYLVIADITGYTEFMTGTELEHAEQVIRQLFDSLLANIQPPLTVSKLEGDAVFAYTPHGSVLQGQTLLEASEVLYCAFRATQQSMILNSTCGCKACANIGSLDLKFVLHFGAFLISKIGAANELTGPDVILTHRLLKNSIPEATGIQAYAFFTEACAEATALEEFTARLQTHAETYEHLGEVRGFVHDLGKVWEREREKRRIVVGDDQLWFEVQADLPVPASLAWDYLTEPDCRQRWLEADSVKMLGLGQGLMGAGSIRHCHHGGRKVVQTIVDWKPFDYLTTETAVPLGGLVQHTTQIEPSEGGVRVVWRFGKPSWPNLLARLTVGPILSPTIKKTLNTAFSRGGGILREMIESDLASGKVVVEPSPVPVSGD